MADHPSTSADEPMSAAIAQLQDGHPLVLEREGSALAALITIKDLRALESYFEELEERVDRREIEKAREEMGREGTVSWEQVKEESRIVVASMLGVHHPDDGTATPFPVPAPKRSDF